MGGHVNSIEAVGTEGCQLNGRWGLCSGGVCVMEARGDEGMTGGCDYSYTQFLLRPWGAGGYRQGWGQLPDSALSGNSF